MNQNQKEMEKALAARTRRDRMSGILVHPTSFPSPHGIGDLGQGARDFIDFLKETGQHLWQVLPLGPTGFGDSPYQSLSAFAGQIYIISPEDLKKEGLLQEADFEGEPEWDPRKVDYGPAIEFKVKLLKKAYAHFLEMEAHTPAEKNLEPSLSDRFREFCREEADWLDDYALFCSLKDHFEGRCWLDWDADLREGRSAAKQKYAQTLKQEIRFFKFTQFLFQEQWTALRLYAAEREVEIIGDIPIFMAIDNCDVWADKKLFRLDSKGYPIEVAGVPPDYFSATGQLWGNPLYDWEYHEKTGYEWWIRRIQRQLELVDYVRIDHFRGFVSYWAIPADAETAIEGAWKEGPGEKLFLALQKKFGEDLPIIAEDLGNNTPENEALLAESGFPGMKVLQFGFENMNDHSYIPHYYVTPNCVCYTGTHDNDTTVGWYRNQSEEVKDRIRIMGNCDGSGVSLDFIRFALGSIAKYAIFPLQDLLQMDSDARMNTPGVAAANWAFRYEQSDLDVEWRREWLLRYTKVYGRI